MKKTFFFLLFIVKVYSINAQTIPITKYWGNLSIGVLTPDIIEVTDNAYYILVKKESFLYPYNNNIILKTDSNCNVIDSLNVYHYHKMNKKFILNKFCKLKQKIIGIGYAYDSISNKKQLWLSEFNTNLNIIKDTLLFDFDSNFTPFNIYYLVNSKSEIIFAIPDSSKMYSDSSNTFLCSIDSNFNVNSYNSIYTRFGNGLSLVEIVPKNVIHIISIEKILEINQNNLTFDSTVWSQNINSAFIAGLGAKAINDTTYFHPGTYPFMKYLQNGFGINTLIYIHNKNGKVIDSILIGDMQKQFVKTSSENIAFSSTDSIFITGTNNSLDSLSFLNQEDNTIFLWNISSNGQINWQKYYGLGKKYSVNYIIKTNDGGCFLTGDVWDWHIYFDFLTDIFFLKVDRYGNITGSSGINEKIIQREILVYPNPANSFINFDLGLYKDFKMNIYNSLGQNVLQQSIAAGYASINISNFKPGIYFYKLTDKTGKTISGKFVKD